MRRDRGETGVDLIVIPVFNEEKHLGEVIRGIQSLDLRCQILVVDDGSTDKTAQVVHAADVDHFIMHKKNFGPGRALATGFEFAIRKGFDILVTVDGDGQHNVEEIPNFLNSIFDADIVSGNRFSPKSPKIGSAPLEKVEATSLLTKFVNKVTGYSLHDAFCGFKAYKVNSLAKIKLTLQGFAWPLELFVQARKAGLSIKEIPVSMIYLDTSKNWNYYAKVSRDETIQYLRNNFDLKNYQQILIFFQKRIAGLDWDEVKS